MNLGLCSCEAGFCAIVLNSNGDTMAEAVKTEFHSFGSNLVGNVVVFVDDSLKLGTEASKALGAMASETIVRAASVEGFKGKAKSAMSLAAPAGLSVDRLTVIGVGGEKDRAESSAPFDWASLGGFLAGKLVGRKATVIGDVPGLKPDAAAIADMALGGLLRAYKFNRYKTKNKDENAEETLGHIAFMTSDSSAARKAFKAREAVAEGVTIARDLVNEPPNVVDPKEFAKRAEALKKVGIEVEILDEKALKKIGMRALLAVGQGSRKESYVAIMRWNGAKGSDKPVAFVGKGVCFDSGGISIKPAANMEDMKGDMAGAACVVGLMHALARRKAKVNAVGIIGLVENMPGGEAQRPGDIVTSLSGQTIEIINTDAEGRLVLADVLWYVQDRFKPKFMVNLATLTGAILVALGQDYAGLFSNNDELAGRITQAGTGTGEKVWRMPLGPEHDKMIESKFADIRNSAGRYAGSCTAAAFLKRFVNGTPWAHLDIAGTAMGSPQTDINQSWSSGWGVRTLDRLVREHYED